MMIRLVTLILALLIASGCSESSSDPAPKLVRTTTVTEADAISIAKQAVRDNDGSWNDSAQYQAEPMGNGWQVSAEGPTGFRLIVIDESGKVVKYEG